MVGTVRAASWLSLLLIGAVAMAEADRVYLADVPWTLWMLLFLITAPYLLVLEFLRANRERLALAMAIGWGADEGGAGANASCKHRNDDGCLHRSDGERQKKGRGSGCKVLFGLSAMTRDSYRT